MAANGPLEGIRVLDLSSVVMGPLGAQMLGDLGADVIHIEDRAGNTNRAMGPGPHPELSGVALNLLRNKRSVRLDLKSVVGRDAFLRLAATSDVVVTNLRPAPLARLKLTYADVAAVRPDIVFCRAHGWSTESGKADAPAFDDIMQSACAVGDLFERMGAEPSLFPSLIADKVAGMTIAYAVLAALVHRARTGEGQDVEVPMIDVTKAFMLVEHGAGAIPSPPSAPAGYTRILTTQRRPQRTLDGWMNMLPYTREHYEAIFAAGGRDDLVGDDRFATRRGRIANGASLYRDVASVLVQRSTEEWLRFCETAGIPATKAATLDELVESLPEAEHPHVGRYRVIPQPVRFSASPTPPPRPAPLIGEHTASVLAEAGFSPAEIEAIEAGSQLTS
ncbi:MAG: CaiB/BaiF CoA transferase family protein [Acidimicrobiales bacterium]